MTIILFIIAGLMNTIAGLIHVWCIAGGNGVRYRVLGAGERLARMADDGKMYPHIITAGIAGALLFLAGWHLVRLGWCLRFISAVASVLIWDVVFYGY